MRPIAPLLLLSALCLAGCPQAAKTTSAPTAPAPTKTLSKTVFEAETRKMGDPVAKKPQVTYFAFKG